MISLTINDDKPMTQIEMFEAILRAHPEGVDTIGWLHTPLQNEWRARKSEFKDILIERGNKERVAKTYLGNRNFLYKLVAVQNVTE